MQVANDFYRNAISDNPVLSPEQERKYLQEMHEHKPDDPEYKQAMDTLILCNQRLVVSIANNYAFDKQDFDDLVQEGNLGLIRALEKFDFSKKKENGMPYRFTTYATWWITQSCQRFHENFDRSIRVPVHVRTEYNRIRKLQDSLAHELGREPSIEETAEALPDDFPHGRIRTLYAELESINNKEDERPLLPDEEHRKSELKRDIYREKVEYLNKLQKMMSYTLSLNQSVGDNGDAEVGDFVPDEKMKPSDLLNKMAEQKVMKELIEKTLDPREQEIIKRRYGFYGEKYTLDESAKPYGLTRERVRQIENRAIRKLTIAMMSSKECLDTFSIDTDNPEIQRMVHMLCKSCTAEDSTGIKKLCNHYPDHCKYCTFTGLEGER